MAIMKSCCCCGVRSGSIASAIYSLIISLIGAALFTLMLTGMAETKEALYELQQEYPDIFGNLDVDAYVAALTADYILADIFLVSVFITSIILIVGINKDSKEMLVPFMAAKAVGFVWYLFAFAVSLYEVSAMGTKYAGPSAIALLILLGPFLAGDVVCFLCAFSQYQEYRDGRGRLSDVVATQRQTTVIVHQQQQIPAGTGGFGYQPMQDPPPSYAFPAPAQKPNIM